MKEKSAIREIFSGQCTCNKIKRDSEVVELWKEADGYLDLLREKLKDEPEICDLLFKYDDCAGKAHAEDLVRYYAEGFKLGLLTGIEVCE